MGVPPLVSSILQCLRADYYALLLVHFRVFYPGLYFYPSSCYRFASSVDLGKLASGFHCIMSKLSGMYCLDSSHRIKNKNTYANFLYISLFSSNRTDRNIHLILWKSIRHSSKFFHSGVEVRLQALNDRVELLERKNSAISGSPRSWWRRILLRLQGSSASTSTRN